MLHSLRSLKEHQIKATDGKIGSVDDLYFDERVWTIRYLVANTGGWLSTQLVLLSPQALGSVDWKNKHIDADLSRRQIENSPGIDKDMPVSRQKELELLEYYHWNDYWAMQDITIPNSGLVISGVMDNNKDKKEAKKQNNKPYLRSMNELNGYNVHATDGECGHIHDFFIEDEEWHLRFAVVDTSHIPLMGKKVLIPPEWIESIDWSKRSVFLNISKELVEKSPEYDSEEPFDQKLEEKAYDYYERPKEYS